KPGTLEPLDATSAPRELTPLADAMNDYVRRLDEHMSAHGRFIAYASHQLRTVLTVLNTQVSYALGNADPAAREDALRGIRDGVRQGIRLVNQLLLLFTAEAGAAQPLREAEVDLAEVVQHVLEELAVLAQARNIDFRGDAVRRGQRTRHSGRAARARVRALLPAARRRPGRLGAGIADRARNCGGEPRRREAVGSAFRKRPGRVGNFQLAAGSHRDGQLVPGRGDEFH